MIGPGSADGYANDGAGSFSAMGLSLDALVQGRVRAGDVDGDGRVDLFLTGDAGSAFVADSYLQNSALPINQEPAPPNPLPATVLGDGSIQFDWTIPFDAETVGASLTYDVRVGTTPGAGDVVAAPARADGQRLVARPGRLGTATSWTLANPPAVPFLYWSVQAVDAGLRGSAFSSEGVVALTSCGDTFTDDAGAVLAAQDGLCIATGDWNGDGTPDVVIGRDGDNRLLLNSGGALVDGTIAPIAHPGRCVGLVMAELQLRRCPRSLHGQRRRRQRVARGRRKRRCLRDRGPAYRAGPRERGHRR